jgi:hypothetical protein
MTSDPGLLNFSIAPRAPGSVTARKDDGIVFRWSQLRIPNTRRLLGLLAGHIGQPGPEHYDFDPRKRRYG